MSEIWKAIPHYEKYEVSNFGNIRSFVRTKERLLHQYDDSKGYKRVWLSSEKQTRSFYVHVLVLSAFSTEDRSFRECNHKNGIKHDNKLDNLEWVTRRENAIHACHTGLNKGTKLTPQKVSDIKRLLISGSRCSDLAKVYDVHITAISKIAVGKNWASILPSTPSLIAMTE